MISLNYISLQPIFMQLGADICWMCDNNLASDKYAQKTVPHIFLLQLYKKNYIVVSIQRLYVFNF